MDGERILKSIKSYNSVQHSLKKKPIQEFDDGSFVTDYKLDDGIVCFVDYMLGEMVSMEIMLSVSKSYLDDPEAVNMFRQFITSLVEKGSEIEGLNHKLCELDENFKKRFGLVGYALELCGEEYAELFIDSDDEDEEDFEDDTGLHYLAAFTFNFFDEEGFKFAKKCLDENGELHDNTAMYEMSKWYIE